MSDARAHSVVVARLRGLRKGLGKASEHSTVVAMGTATTASFERRFAAPVGALGRTVRSSWLYRWLTAEPEPEVIVIDLRETWTVGPILAVLDRLVTRVAGSVVGRRGAALAATFEDRPVQLLSAVLVVALAASVLFPVLVAEESSGFGPRLLLLGFALAGTRESRSLDELAETRVGSALAKMFELPEENQPRRER
jgi:hypothetical protein